MPLASKNFPMAIRHGAPGRQKLPDGSPWQQFLPYSYSPRGCQHLCHSAASLQTLYLGSPASKSFPMALCHGAPASKCSAIAPPLCSALPRRPGQQQTSSGGEEYSGLASNLAHLGRIC